MLTGPVPPPSAPTLPPGLVGAPARAPKRSRKRSGRPLVIVAVVVVVVVGAVAAVVVLKASGLKTGSGTATITWKVPAHGTGTSKSLSGTVDGLTLTARSSGSAPPAGASRPRATGRSLRPRGPLVGNPGGKTFDLDVTESFGSASSSTTDNKYLGNFKITYRITGTYGTDQVRATATADPRHSGRLLFSATVGSYHVKGSASETKKGATSGKFRASFVVTG